MGNVKALVIIGICVAVWVVMLIIRRVFKIPKGEGRDYPSDGGPD